MLHQVLLIIHLLAATIWVGGHLILAIRFLPLALKNRDPEIIRNFEKRYESIGIPALLLLIITGVALAYQYDITPQRWFSFSNSMEKVVSLKLIFLFLTLCFGIHARFFIIPKLSEHNLVSMAIHIIGITLVAVTMLVLGSTIRFGGI